MGPRSISNLWEGKIILWHLVWIIAGIAWILYWFNKRGFIAFAWVASGKAEEVLRLRSACRR